MMARGGENIAYKNPHYSELTAQYWIWKNDHDSGIVGLCHYRRFFSSSGLSLDPKHFLDEKRIEKYLKNADAIVPKRAYLSRGAYIQYLDGGSEKDLSNTREAIEHLYPEYLPYFERYFVNSAYTRFCNMIITRKSIFDEYSEWLFRILDYVERKTDLTSYPKEWQRVFGCISERLLEVWLRANHIKVRSTWVVNTEEKNTGFPTRAKRFARLSDIKGMILFPIRKRIGR